MKMKKIMAVALIMILAVGSVFAGGASETQGPQVLKVAGLKGAYGDEYWKLLEAGFEKAYPNVDVQLTIAANIEDIVNPQIMAGEGPDIFYIATNREARLTETMLSTNSLVDLSGLLDKKVYGEDVLLKDRLIGKFVDEANATNDGTLMLPLFFSSNGLFYNADLFYANNGNGVEDGKVDGKYEIPTNWDEFLQLGEILNEERKTNPDTPYLFTYPTAGYLDCLIPATIISAAGHDVAQQAFAYEPVWDTPEVRKVFEYLGALKDYILPTTVANANGANFRKNQQAVIDGKALFMCNGDWVKGEMKDTTPEGFNWGSMPYLGFGGERFGIINIEQLWVTKDTQVMPLVEDFILYMFSREGLQCFVDGCNGGYVPADVFIDLADASPNYNVAANDGFRGYYDGSASFIGWSSFKPVEVAGVNWKATYCEYMDSVMNGSKTVDQWINQLMTDSAKLQAAL